MTKKLSKQGYHLTPRPVGSDRFSVYARTSKAAATKIPKRYKVVKVIQSTYLHGKGGLKYHMIKVRKKRRKSK